MARYKVGLVGAHRGTSLVAPFAIFPDTEITALCDVDERALADAGKHFGVAEGALYTDFGAFLRAPTDILVVATPMPLHVEQAVLAMQAGKHVLSEVTAATSLAECETLVAAVKHTGRIYMMGENSCYSHFIGQWQRWIDAGRLGDIFYAESEYIHALEHMLQDPETGEVRWRANRPPIHYCTHSLGPLLMLMRDRVVQACGVHSGYGIRPDLGPGCLNMEVALFRTQKGAVIKILRSQVALREPPMHYYSLYGTAGFIETDRGGGWRGGEGKLYVEGEMSKEAGFQVIDCPLSDPDAPPEALVGGHGTSEYYLVRDFIDAIATGSRPPIDVVRAVDFTAPGICAHESAMSGGRWIDVPQFEW